MPLLAPKEYVYSAEALSDIYSKPAAEQYTRWLATHHYENFHVVSFLLPKRLHQDFYNVYAFCRWADDLGDEIGDREESLRLLAWWRAELEAMYAGRVKHPVFVALEETVHKYGLPRQLFSDLISAFEQDQRVTRYANWGELFSYCRCSANPVGRLVLRLCGCADDERDRMSDATCTALQLANFWQDVTVDLEKDRVYLPLDLLARHGYTVEDLAARKFNPSFQAVMREAVDVARKLFAEGLPLAKTVDRRLGFDLDLFSRGGMRVLDKIEQQNYNVLSQRPAVSKSDRLGLVAHALLRAAWATGFPYGPAYRGTRPPVMDARRQHSCERSVDLATSYAFCRRVARTRARNFYYSFLLLSREQRDAMCAIYAFMRYCDDISEGEGASREAIDRWRGDLDRALAGQYSDNPLWPAFHDTIQRYQIPCQYFHEMISGVSSDLEPRQIQTFDELYRYCYQVASVVGLTIIHIFGFESKEALALAEKCGIAFQLTNILRDVREDAENQRVYIPLEDIRRFGADLAKRDESFIRLLSFEAERAHRYYEESRPLVELVHKRSRASLWALIEIYRRLLTRIERSNFDVFSRRIRVPTWEKIGILLTAALH